MKSGDNLSLKILLTGRPGIGKTTALLKIVEMCKRDGYRVGGMITREVRKRTRIGFEIEDLATGERGTLASIYAPMGPRVGKYRVVLEDLNRVGAGAIERALRYADVVFIDEIGPMELYSRRFKEAVEAAFLSSKPLVGTIHIRASRYPFARGILERFRPEVYELTLQNRESVPSIVYRKLKSVLEEK